MKGREDVASQLYDALRRTAVNPKRRDGLHDEIHKLQRRIALALKHPTSMSEQRTVERLSEILESRTQTLAELNAPPTPEKQVTSLPLPEFDTPVEIKALREAGAKVNDDGTIDGEWLREQIVLAK